MNTLEDFCGLLKLRNDLTEREQELSSWKREIETTHKLLRSVGSSIKIQEKSRFEEILKLSEKIEIQRGEMTIFLEDKEEEYEKLLTESLKEHQVKLSDFQVQLGNPELVDPGLTVDEATSRLEILGEKLSKIGKQHSLLKEFW